MTALFVTLYLENNTSVTKSNYGIIKGLADLGMKVTIMMPKMSMKNGSYDDTYDLSIAAVPYTVSIPFGICDLDGRNVKGIVEKPTYNYYANAGIYLMKRDVLKYIPNDRFYNATDLIADLIAANKQVIRYPLNGTWIDIGNKDDYQKAQDLVGHLKI